MVTTCGSVFMVLDLDYPEIFFKDQTTAHWLLALENLGFDGDQVLHVMWWLLKGPLQSKVIGMYTALLFQRKDFAKILKKKMTLYKNIFLLWVCDWILIIMRKCHGMCLFLSVSASTRTLKKMSAVHISEQRGELRPSQYSALFPSPTVLPTHLFSLSFSPAVPRFPHHVSPTIFRLIFVPLLILLTCSYMFSTFYIRALGY